MPSLVTVTVARRSFFTALASKVVDKVMSKTLAPAIARDELLTEANFAVEKFRPMEKSLKERLHEQREEREKLVPLEIAVSACRRYIELAWQQSGRTGPPVQPTRLLAEVLRAESPSTDVIGSSALIYGRRGITIVDVVPVGNYAVRLRFSDDHTGGIFPYDYLKNLGDEKFRIMRQYVRRLRSSGKSRHPPVRTAQQLRRQQSRTAEDAPSRCGHGH